MARLCAGVAGLAAVVTVVACNGQVGGAPSGAGDNATHGESDVVSTQRSAVSYAEAVVIEPNDAYAETCTGVVIAPRVVLTAAHCVVFVAARSWRVTAPFATGGPETHTARDGEPMDAAFRNVSSADYALHALRDVGVLYVDVPFANLKLPTLAPRTYAVDKGSPPIYVAAVGRAVGGGAGVALTSPALLNAASGAGDWSSIEYETIRLTAAGESGGPLFSEGTHQLVAVHAHVGASGKTDAWARLDGDVYTWITQKVSSHGGWTHAAPR
jgi:V8-like Glu-specific endopeptidase